MNLSGQPLKISYSQRAVQQLDDIWEWNEKAYGRAHAFEYVEFPRVTLEKLSITPGKGRVIGLREVQQSDCPITPAARSRHRWPDSPGPESGS